jgi:hypothetical protein
MARIRTVKPDYFRHELLQDLEIAHPGMYPMMVFQGLWGHCDSQGIFEWKPRHLKLDILPFIPFDMEKTLKILNDAGMMIRYSVDGKEYGKIETFNDHQRLTGKESTEGDKYPDITSESIVNQLGSIGEILESQEGKGKEKEKEGNIKNIVLFNFLQSLLNLGVEKKLADDWMKVRKLKKASNTETAFNLFTEQARKAGLSISDTVLLCVSNDWKGFKASWLTPKANSPSGYQSAAQQSKTWADKLHGIGKQNDDSNTIDI